MFAVCLAEFAEHSGQFALSRISYRFFLNVINLNMNKENLRWFVLGLLLILLED